MTTTKIWELRRVQTGIRWVTVIWFALLVPESYWFGWLGVLLFVAGSFFAFSVGHAVARAEHIEGKNQ